MNEYYIRTSSSIEIKDLLIDMQSVENKKKIDTNIWKIWIKCIDEVLKEPIESRKLLELKKVFVLYN